MRREALLSLLLVACGTPAATQPSPASPTAPNAMVTTPAPVGVTPSATASSTSTPRKKREPAPVVASTVPLAKEPMVEQILAEGGAALQKVLAAPEVHRFQVVYGTIENGKLQRHNYRADAEYFFPASSMKVPITLATVGRSTKAGISRDSLLRLYPVSGNGEPLRNSSSSPL